MVVTQNGNLIEHIRPGASAAGAKVADVLRLQPNFSTTEYMRKSVLLEHAEDRELLREGLIKAGLAA